MNNSYITIIKEKRTVLSRKRVPLNQNECTADFRIGVPFEQNLQTSNSSTENLPKNSRSTIYCAGSFLAKLSAPLVSYLFSTYAHRLIQYAYFSQCYRSKQMVLESFVSISTIPILVGRTAPYRYGKV